MNKEQRLQDYWNTFAPAWEETSVPDNAVFPRITYEGRFDDFGTQVSTSVSIWVRSSSWKQAEDIKHAIELSLTRGGIVLRYDDGAMWIKRGEPFSTRLSDSSDDMIRRIFLNIEIEFLD